MITIFKKLLWLRASKTNPVASARKLGVEVGEGCRLIDFKLGTFGSEPYMVKIGNNVTVASGVRFVTHDGGVAVFRKSNPNLDVVAPVRVGDNVFIGLNSIILPGVSIGSDCVIGAGSIVTKSIPSGSIAVGVPARVIKKTEEYQKSVLAAAVDTKGMSKSKKREVLTEIAAQYHFIE